MNYSRICHVSVGNVSLCSVLSFLINSRQIKFHNPEHSECAGTNFMKLWTGRGYNAVRRAGAQSCCPADKALFSSDGRRILRKSFFVFLGLRWWVSVCPEMYKSWSLTIRISHLEIIRIFQPVFFFTSGTMSTFSNGQMFRFHWAILPLNDLKEEIWENPLLHSAWSTSVFCRQK